MSSDLSRVSVRWVGDEAFVGSDPIGHSVVFDSSARGPGLGIGPMKALLCSIGACSGIDLVAILRKRGQKLTALRMEIEGSRRSSGHPRPFEHIQVRYLVSGRGLQRNVVEEAVSDSIMKYCSAAATVNEKAKIEFSFEITED